MQDKIFKEKQLKKTLVETIELPDGEMGAILINNKNEIARGVKLDDNMQPILTEQESTQLKNEQDKFNTTNPMEAHMRAVEENKSNNGEIQEAD